MKLIRLPLGILSIIMLACAVTLAQKANVSTQKPVAKKLLHAVERSQDAGRIIMLLALLPDSGLPRELVEGAEAIGVFPKVERDTALFTHMSLGYGVISARQEGGWTLPAFYAFGGTGFGNPFKKDTDTGVILLFMTKDAVAAFEKGGVQLKGEKKAVAGPVGVITDEQRKELANAHILAYTYYNGKLNGDPLSKGFLSNFGLNPDNNINKPIYRMKGREVLAGKQVDTTTLLPGVPAFQEALQKHYGKSQ